MSNPGARNVIAHFSALRQWLFIHGAALKAAALQSILREL